MVSTTSTTGDGAQRALHPGPGTSVGVPSCGLDDGVQLIEGDLDVGERGGHGDPVLAHQVLDAVKFLVGDHSDNRLSDDDLVPGSGEPPALSEDLICSGDGSGSRHRHLCSGLAKRVNDHGHVVQMTEVGNSATSLETISRLTQCLRTPASEGSKTDHQASPPSRHG